MPNYSLVANSTFQPLTYQEIALPLDRQEALHENLLQQMEQLSDKADILEAMGRNDRDSKAYSQYKAYSDHLREEADNLYRNGLDLNGDARMRVTELRRRYNQEVVPIQNAWNKRKEEAELQMKARISNPSLRFTRDAASSSIDDYLANPEGGFGVVNLDSITAQMAGMAKNLEASILSGHKEGVDDVTYRYVRKYGLDANMINNWLDNPNSNPALTNMMNQVLEKNGINPEMLRSNAGLYGEALNAAKMGAWESIGKVDDQLHDDKKALIDYQTAKQAALINLRAQAKMAAAAASGAGGINGTNNVSEYDLPMGGADYSGAKDQQKAMETLGYVMKNGKLSPTGKVTINGKQASIFGRDGRVLNRKQFVAQAGNSEKDQREFSKYFDKMVDAGKTLGIYGKMYTQKDLVNQYNTLRNNSAAGSAHVYALNYEKGDWNTNSKNYPVREIKSYKGGKPVFDTKTITLNDVLNIKDSGKNPANISAYWSNTEGNQGIVLTTTIDGENRRFFIDAANMPENNIREALQYFDAAEKLKKNNRADDARKAISIGLTKLHLGLTSHPKGDDYSPIKRASYKQQGLDGDYTDYSDYEED